MSAYAAPGLFPPLSLASCYSFQTQAAFKDDVSLVRTTRNQSSSGVQVRVKDAKVDTAVLIHALLQSHQNQAAKRCRPRTLRQQACHMAAEEEAFQYELYIGGWSSSSDSNSGATVVQRSLSQLSSFQRDLKHEILGNSSNSRLLGSPVVPALPRFHDPITSASFPWQPSTGLVGRGLVVLQDLLRSQIPLLQEWFDNISKLMEPSGSLAWNRFLAEEQDVGSRGEASLLRFAMTCSPSHGSLERLGPIEESETENESDQGDC